MACWMTRLRGIFLFWRMCSMARAWSSGSVIAIFLILYSSFKHTIESMVHLGQSRPQGFPQPVFRPAEQLQDGLACPEQHLGIRLGIVVPIASAQRVRAHPVIRQVGTPVGDDILDGFSGMQPRTVAVE